MRACRGDPEVPSHWQSCIDGRARALPGVRAVLPRRCDVAYGILRSPNEYFRLRAARRYWGEA